MARWTWMMVLAAGLPLTLHGSVGRPAPDTQPHPASSPIPGPNQTQPEHPAQTRVTTRVVRVIDGDTIEVTGGEHVRLSLINAPESHERFGDRATRALKRMVEHQEVTLVYGPRARDHYGRLIASVYLGDMNVQLEMIRQGMAYLFVVGTDIPDGYGALLAAQLKARAERRGIWMDARYQRPVTITSFHANAPGNDRKNLLREYLRLVNISDKPINLAGWSMTNSRGDRVVFGTVVIPPGYTFKVVSGKESEAGDGGDGSIAVYWNSDREVWHNHGDRATLYDAHGHEVLRRTYSPKTTRGW